MRMRLVRYLAQCGVASRRAAADIVRNGAVTVNGETVTNVALQISEGDRVTVDGQPVALSECVYLMLHKPAGTVSSRRDPHNPETVVDCAPPELRERVKPVGRLDKDTTGILLLTDDGDLAHRLTHPRYGVEKTYVARVRGQVSPRTLERLQRGVRLDDGATSPARARLIEKSRSYSTIEIVIHEGRNRQVKRMCEAVGHRVESLRRTRFGPLVLPDDLSPGATRPLSSDQLRNLRRAAGLTK